MGNPWSINVSFLLVYEEKDCQTMFFQPWKKNTPTSYWAPVATPPAPHNTLPTPRAISLTCSIHTMPLWPSKAANYRKSGIAINSQYFRTLNIGYPKANADAVSLSSVHWSEIFICLFSKHWYILSVEIMAQRNRSEYTFTCSRRKANEHSTQRLYRTTEYTIHSLVAETKLSIRLISMSLYETRKTRPWTSSVLLTKLKLYRN
jgi:hypothetical protein